MKARGPGRPRPPLSLQGLSPGPQRLLVEWLRKCHVPAHKLSFLVVFVVVIVFLFKHSFQRSHPVIPALQREVLIHLGRPGVPHVGAGFLPASLAGCDHEGCTGERKVISMSLYGDNPRYTSGTVKNAEVVKDLFPDWQLWVYVPESYATPIPDSVMQSLQQANAVIVKVSDATIAKVGFGMNQRFLPAADDTVDKYAVRDCDCRLLLRDRWAMDEWEESGLPFHVLRDHPSHSRYTVSGGLWGARKGAVDILPLLERAEGGKAASYMEDMNILDEHVWPLMQRQGVLQHDSFSCRRFGAYGRPFPFPRAGAEHLGAVFTVDDELRKDDVAMLTGDSSSLCASPELPTSSRRRVSVEDLLACALAGRKWLSRKEVLAAGAEAHHPTRGGPVHLDLQAAALGLQQAPSAAGLALIAGGDEGGGPASSKNSSSTLLYGSIVQQLWKSAASAAAVDAAGTAAACSVEDGKRLAAGVRLLGGTAIAAVSPSTKQSPLLPAEEQSSRLSKKKNAVISAAPATVAMSPHSFLLELRQVFVDGLSGEKCPGRRNFSSPSSGPSSHPWQPLPALFSYHFSLAYSSFPRQQCQEHYLAAPQLHERVKRPHTYYSPRLMQYLHNALLLEAAYSPSPFFVTAFALPPALWYLARGPSNGKLLLPAGNSAAVEALTAALQGGLFRQAMEGRPSGIPGAAFEAGGAAKVVRRRLKEKEEEGRGNSRAGQHRTSGMAPSRTLGAAGEHKQVGGSLLFQQPWAVAHVDSPQLYHVHRLVLAGFAEGSADLLQSAMQWQCGTVACGKEGDCSSILGAASAIEAAATALRPQSLLVARGEPVKEGADPSGNGCSSRRVAYLYKGSSKAEQQEMERVKASLNSNASHALPHFRVIDSCGSLQEQAAVLQQTDILLLQSDAFTPMLLYLPQGAKVVSVTSQAAGGKGRVGTAGSFAAGKAQAALGSAAVALGLQWEALDVEALSNMSCS